MGYLTSANYRGLTALEFWKIQKQAGSGKYTRQSQWPCIRYASKYPSSVTVVNPHPNSYTDREGQL